MADSTQGEARSSGSGSGRHARAPAVAFALPGPSNADASRTRPPLTTFNPFRKFIAEAQAARALTAQARAAYGHARAYQLAMAYAHIRAYVSLAVKGSGLLALFLSSVILLGGFIDSLDKLGKMDFWCVTAITVIQAAGTIAAEIMENLCAHSPVDTTYMKGILLPKVLKEIISFKTESQQRNMSPSQNHSESGDEENQRDYEPRENRKWYHTMFPVSCFAPEMSTTARSKKKRIRSQNNLSDQGSEEQEAFLSLTLAIRNKLNSADDFDDTIEHNVGRKEFVDKLKSIVNDNCEATPGSLRIVKLCGRIAESMMQCQHYQQYADHFRKSGFESSLSQASQTMSRLESCMLFHGTDFGLKKTVRPLISDIKLERKSSP